MNKISRRIILKGMGIQLILPLLENFTSLSEASALTPNTRKNFIGIFFPNGTFIPNNQPNGVWHWNDSSGVLSTLTQGSDSVKQNVMILRNLFNNQTNLDPHWQNCAGMLSGNIIQLDLVNPRCGKTIDQTIADLKTTPFRSLEIGGPYYHEHLLGDHPNYSHIYMNRISWRTNEIPLTPHTDPYEFFNSLFVTNQTGARTLAYIQSTKKSSLDFVISELNTLAKKATGEGRQALDNYTTSLREIEKGMQSTTPITCTPPSAPQLDYSDINLHYVDRVKQFQQMLVFALKCELTQVSTIMYAPAVSGLLTYSGDLGAGEEHHSCAHHGGILTRSDRLQTVNRMHLNLLKHLLNLLKSNNILNDTLVLYGTDMNDGNLHTTNNIPTLLCGGGNDLKFGQDVTLPNSTPYTRLLLSILSLYGVNLSSLGEGDMTTSGNINSSLST